MKTLVIGAGMAGAACAETLLKAGHEIKVFDQAPRIGGRLFTLKLPWADIDVGAQYFTVRDELFQKQVDNWHLEGIVQRWLPQPWLTDNYSCHPSPDHQTRYIGFKSAQAPVEALLNQVPVYLQQTVEKIKFKNNHWYVELGNHAQAGPFDLVVLAMPMPQARILFDESVLEKFDLPEIEVKATQALAIQLDKPIDTELKWSFVKNRAIDWLGLNNAKPNRHAEAQTWLMHFTDGATEMYKYNGDASFVKLGLLQLKQIFSQSDVGECIHHYSYHHPFARVCSKNTQQSYYWKKELGIGFCGDWCHSGRVEGAYLSGRHLAQAILEIH